MPTPNQQESMKIYAKSQKINEIDAESKEINKRPFRINQNQ